MLDYFSLVYNFIYSSLFYLVFILVLPSLNIILILFLPLLILIAFYTLAERKVMASIQRRQGPHVVGFWGLLQPIADGVKLILKEFITPINVKQYNVLFVFAAIISFSLSLISWCVIPASSTNELWVDLELPLLLIFSLSSLSVYGVILAGWSSNSKYAVLGALRSAAQMISYEIAISFVLLSVGLVSGSLKIFNIVLVQFYTGWYVFALFPLFIIFYISILAETNRAPFDLPEAESELVSGYNIEYSSILFAMFFLGEYSSMLLMSSLVVLFFLGGWHFPFINIFFEIFNVDSSNIFGFYYFEIFIFFFKLVFVSFSLVWVRATFPRYRYDKLMNLGWKIFLPLTFAIFLFLIGSLLFFNGLPSSVNLFINQNYLYYYLNN